MAPSTGAARLTTAQPWPKWRLLTVVVLAHALLLAAWSPLRPQARRTRATTAEVTGLVWLRMLPAEPSARSKADRPPPPPPPLRSQPQAASRVGPASPPPLARDNRAAMTAPAPAPPAQAADPRPWTPPPLVAGPTLPGQPAPPAASAPAPPLNLRLPPHRGPGWAPHPNPAVAAAQMAAPGRDERLAAQWGTDQRLRLEPEGDGHRYRRGRDCLKVLPAREAGLNPWNQNAAPTPRQVAPC